MSQEVGPDGAIKTVDLNFLIFKRPCHPLSVVTCMLWYEAIFLWIAPGFRALSLMSGYLIIGIVGLVGGAYLWFVAYTAIMLALGKNKLIDSGEFKAKATVYANLRPLSILIYVVVSYWLYCSVSFYAGYVFNGFMSGLGSATSTLIFSTIGILFSIIFSVLNGGAFLQAVDILTGGDGTGISDPMMAKGNLGGALGGDKEQAKGDEEFAPQ